MQSKSRQVVALCLSLALGLGLLLLVLNLANTARASEPQESPGQEGGPIIGLASNPLGCLAVGDDLGGNGSGVVNLTWSGQAERARLILSVSGTEAAHTIKVNGQPVASVPIHPYGQGCYDGESFYLDIPPEVLVQGDNPIEITNNANNGSDKPIGARNKKSAPLTSNAPIPNEMTTPSGNSM